MIFFGSGSGGLYLLFQGDPTEKKIKNPWRIVTYIAGEPLAMLSLIDILYDSGDVFLVRAVKLEMKKIK